MQSKILHNKLKEIVIELYQNSDSAIEKFVKTVPELNQLLAELVLSQCDGIEKTKAMIVLINDAIQSGDKLMLADLLAELINMETKECKEQSKKIVDIYEKNRQVVESVDKNIYKKCLEYCESVDVVNDNTIAVDRYGNIQVFVNDRWWRLNSYYDSKFAVKSAVQPICDKGYISVFFLFGLGNLEYVEAVLKTVPLDTIVFIYEFNPKIFALNMHYSDMSIIFKRKNTALFVDGLNDEFMKSYVAYYSDNVLTKYIYTFVSPNYDMAYCDMLTERINLCNEFVAFGLTLDTTIIQRVKFINYARVMNMRLIFHSTLLSEVRSQLKEKFELDKIPVIIAAAGPSLDKNIEQLKKAKGKAFIIAVDSAIRMFDKYDIEPDAIVSIDSMKEKVLFQNRIARNTTLFYCMHSAYDEIAELKGKKILCNTDGLAGAFLEMFEKNEDQISGGGSVANTAFSIAQYLGFKNIITIGLDLAFSGKMKHASVVYSENEVNEAERQYYTEVKGQNGEMLLTYKNFVMYKEWYEKRLKSGEVTMINATEGGALIEGAVYMTLDEAIEKYCTSETDIGIYLPTCKKSFVSQDLKKAKNLINQFADDCINIKELFEKCIHIYEEMLMCKDYQSIQDKLQQINNIDEKVNKFFVMNIISDYAASESERELDQMYRNDGGNGNIMEEIKEIVQRGVAVSKVYAQSAERAGKLFADCVSNGFDTWEE